MLEILDVVLFCLHIAIILFNLFGWIWKATRKFHLFVVGVTLFSWLILGIKFGFGYCFLTDWEWDIKHKLGEINLPASFIKYFLDTYTCIDFSARLVDLFTGVLFGLAITLTAYVNFFKTKSTD